MRLAYIEPHRNLLLAIQIHMHVVKARSLKGNFKNVISRNRAKLIKIIIIIILYFNIKIF